MIEVTEDMIGCLCKFWYHDERDYTIAELMDVACHRKFPSYKGNDCWYSHCQPVKLDEVKFYNINKVINKNIEIKEKICSNIHEVWSRWYKYQRDNSIPKNIERWEAQSNLSYFELSEEDKEKDRKIYKEIMNYSD